jgi:AmmeMemoRadiSam system protein B
MVPVLAGSMAEAVVEGKPPGELEGVGESVVALREAVERRGERVVVVAAVDLAHLGPRFGDPSPPEAGPLEAEDRKTLRLLAEGDAEGFFHDAARGGDARNICGLSAIYMTLRALEGTRGRVLTYGQAADPTGTVSYASVALFG